jgi:hypothetical protein
VFTGPLKSPFLVVSRFVIELQSPGLFRQLYHIFNYINTLPSKSTWTLIQCLTLLHLAEIPLGSIKILQHTDYPIVLVQMLKFDNLWSIVRARYAIGPEA